jgi:hypothetical protein
VFLSAKHYFNVMNSHSPALAAKFTKQALEMYQEIKEKFISPASQRAHKNWRFLAKCSRQIGLTVIEGRTQRALQQFYQSEFWHAANDKQEGAHSVKLNTALAEGKSPEEPIDTGAVTLHISDKRESSVMVGVAYAKFKNLRKRGMRRRSSAGVEGSRGNDSQTNFILPEAAVLTEADA